MYKEVPSIDNKNILKEADRVLNFLINTIDEMGFYIYGTSRNPRTGDYRDPHYQKYNKWINTYTSRNPRTGQTYFNETDTHYFEVRIMETNPWY
jgi:hypothetical protein